MRKLDANLPLYFIATPEKTLNEFLAVQRLTTFLFGAFGAIGIILAGAGLYGVMGFSVNQRMGEFGIRLALGAATQHIVRLIYGQGGRQVAIGLGVGLAAAVAILWTFRTGIGNFLFQVPLTDPYVFLGVTAMIALAASIACLFPALRASRVDPNVALRAE
jgi:ABC-type antimicrobial peptide transport system permease subunit